MSDTEDLRKLAQEFETLMDPARDDRNYIYEWSPPEWWDFDRALVEDQEVTGRVIEIRNLLHRVADHLEADK